MDIADRLKWGPFVSERSWGVIREDMDTEEDPWRFFPFEKPTTKLFVLVKMRLQECVIAINYLSFLLCFGMVRILF